MQTRLPSIAVVDVETTGLFPNRYDRVIEVAAVVVSGRGEVEREFVSLVNPGRDIGPTSIHGISASDIIAAPRFDEIAGSFVGALDGAVAIGGHNVRFDLDFLDSEFRRLGFVFPRDSSLCTMSLAAGGRLADCCRAYGVPFHGEQHHALNDARATAQLLVRLLFEQPDARSQVADLRPLEWPPIPRSARPPITRRQSRDRQSEPSTFLQRLAQRSKVNSVGAVADGAVSAYLDLVTRVLEDRRIDDGESEALLETAVRWGLSGERVATVHSAFLNALCRAALSDGVVSDSERRDLSLVARLLGQEHTTIDSLLDDGAAKLTPVPRTNKVPIDVGNRDLAGSTVCFTGELQCRRRGDLISREMAIEIARASGLTVSNSISKKVDVLVVADPNTQSGKAKRARALGVRILHEAVFWRLLGVSVE